MNLFDWDFFEAVHSGAYAVVRWQIDHGNVDVNDLAGPEVGGGNFEGDTALMLAVQEGHVWIVKLLLEAGADMYIENAWGPTVLFALTGGGDIVKLLLDNGLDPNGVIFGGWELDDDDDNTLLMWAVFLGNIEIVRLLLEKGADPDLQDSDGTTALMYAISQLGQLKLEGGTTEDLAGRLVEVDGIIELLLEKGADPNIKNNEGKSALDFAEERAGESPYNEIIIKLIKKQIAEPGIKAKQRLNIMKATGSPGSLLNHLGDSELLQSILDEMPRPGPAVYSRMETEKQGELRRNHAKVMRKAKAKEKDDKDSFEEQVKILVEYYKKVDPKKTETDVIRIVNNRRPKGKEKGTRIPTKQWLELCEKLNQKYKVHPLQSHRKKHSTKRRKKHKKHTKKKHRKT